MEYSKIASHHWETGDLCPSVRLMNERQSGGLCSRALGPRYHGQPADPTVVLLSQDGPGILKAGVVDSTSGNDVLSRLVCHTLMENCPVVDPRGPSETSATTVRWQPASFGAKVFMWADAVIQNWAHLWQYTPQIETP